MSTEMFASNTYGIGELITQRKIFVVPLHQRNFSWGEEQVEQFLIDVKSAFHAGAQEYFIGLMVLQRPRTQGWEVLDGQQRLTTVTMIYSAIRNWLKERNFNEDANQIEAEYLGVRQLGGEFSTRVRLNFLNHDVFERHVIKASPTEELVKERTQVGKKNSNYLLLNAAIICREWIGEFVNGLGESNEQKAKSLFQLSRFLETGVKVVTVDVATDADAFVLFESLNNRGADLSALDLVKNYIFSVAKVSTYSELELMWGRLTDLINGTDADDFLKYFWTARFGIVQKNDLFQKIRQAFEGANAAETLLGNLLDAAEFAEALDDDSHPLWAGLARETWESVAGIKAIGSKQARPLLYSAVKKLDETTLNAFLKDLLVSLVRFQMFGHGRTGVLEKVLGRISPAIWNLSISTRTQWLAALREIVTTDEQFLSDFNAHQEQKISRAHYVLTEIEKATGTNHALLVEAKTVYLRPDSAGVETEDSKQIGAYFLLEKQLCVDYIKAIKNSSPDEVFNTSKRLFASSAFLTTASFSAVPIWNRETVDRRTEDLAVVAATRWKIS